MDPKINETLADASLLRLVAMFITPFAIKLNLEKVLPGFDRLQAAGVHYRNNLKRFQNMDNYINRSASVVAWCFGTMAVIQFIFPSIVLYAIVMAVLLLTIFHIAVMGIYRHELKDRVEKYAKILGMNNFKMSDQPMEFPQHREERLKREEHPGNNDEDFR